MLLSSPEWLVVLFPRVLPSLLCVRLYGFQLLLMDEIEMDRDKQKARCGQLEAQLEISQKIVDTQEAALAAKEVKYYC